MKLYHFKQKKEIDSKALKTVKMLGNISPLKKYDRKIEKDNLKNVNLRMIKLQKIY